MALQRDIALDRAASVVARVYAGLEHAAAAATGDPVWPPGGIAGGLLRGRQLEPEAEPGIALREYLRSQAAVDLDRIAPRYSLRHGISLQQTGRGTIAPIGIFRDKFRTRRELPFHSLANAQPEFGDFLHWTFGLSFLDCANFCTMLRA